MTKTLWKALASLPLLAVLFAAVTMQSAQAVSPDIVISQVYGGGGNTGAPYLNDFVELFNRGTTTVSLSGMSVQYASATGTGNFGSNAIAAIVRKPGARTVLPCTTCFTGRGWGQFACTGCNRHGKYEWLGRQGRPRQLDFRTSLQRRAAFRAARRNWHSSRIWSVTEALTSTKALQRPALSATTAALRLANGCTETDNNASDFAASAPAPRNTASSAQPLCAGRRGP